MDPFKITCVTCRAVLTVRKESLIGQIIACPRCAMMVQIVAPAGTPKPSTAAPPAAKAAAAAAAIVTPPSFESFESGVDLTSPPAALASPAAASAIAVDFDDAAESTSPHALPSAPAATPPAVEPVATGWASYKFAALLLAGAIAGSALVAATLSYLGGNGEVAATPSVPATPAVAEPAPPTTPPETDATGLVASAAALPEDQSPLSPLAADPPTPEAPAAAPTRDEVAPEVVAAPAEAPVEPATEPTTETPPPAEAPAANIVADTTPADEPSAPRLRINPLDLDPEGLDLATLRHGPQQDPLAASQLPAEAAPAPSVPAAEPNADADAAAPRLANLPVRRDERAGAAGPMAAPMLLARRIPAIKVDKMPLCRLVDLAVQLSGIPVSVTPEQLRMAAVSAGQPASADVKDATIEAFLTAALKPLRLEPVVVDEQIILQRIGGDRPRTVDYAVDDLASNQDELEQLAAWIQQLVAPESWAAAGGSGTIRVYGNKLHVEQAESIQYELLVLLERWRLARGLPLRSKYPSALVKADAAPVALAERLDAPVTFTFSQYTPLREIFRHWQEELEVAVLVDWPAIARERLWPNTRIACSAADKPWGAAMDEVLEPLGLAWRPIDRRVIEITTLAKAQLAPQLEIYRLDPPASGEAGDLTSEVDQRVAAAGGPAPAAGSTATILDGAHHLLLVRQPATIQRQIAAWLAEKQLLAPPDSAVGQ